MRTSTPGLRVSYAATAAEMRSMDKLATDSFGIPGIVLMENAGRSVADFAVQMLGSDPFCKNVVVVCGSGNNGGDGFVAARHLLKAGALPWILHFGDRQSIKGDALMNLDIAQKIGLDIIDGDLERLKNYLSDADLVIDALLGTGIRGDVREPYSGVIEELNRASCPILSVDIPSGVNADTGQVCGTAVDADATVTFALPKVGLLTGDGLDRSGELVVADISIPEAIYDHLCPAAIVPDTSDVAALLPLRSQNSNKGIFGHVAIVGGSVGMTGAATLASEGAMRIGTGLTTVLVPESLNDIMEVKLTEAMTIPVPQGKARAFGMASLDSVLDYVNKWDSAVIGPGFGRDEDTIEFSLALIERLEKPAIIDADALYAVSRDLSVLSRCKAPLVITPHPGEMATLLGTTAGEVQSNRLEIARSFAGEHGVTVVLKGAGTVVAEPEGTAYINTTGTPGMATGGTGDVLSGMIGGLLAQSRSCSSAATAAVYLHGLAGEIAARKRGEAAMLAGDLADSIGDAIQEVQAEF